MVTQADQRSEIPKLTVAHVKEQLALASNIRVFLFDYDGALAMAHKLPEFARPSPALLSTLTALAAQPRTAVFIMSGRTRQVLDEWFDETGVGLIAEHGSFYKHGVAWRSLLPSVSLLNTCLSSLSLSALTPTLSTHSDLSVSPPALSLTHLDGWISTVDPIESGSWRDSIRPLFQYYTDRTPGSFIEEKEINLTWHYRNTDPEFGNWQAAELHVNLEKILSHMAVKILPGNKTLELHPTSVDKSVAVKSILYGLSQMNLEDEHVTLDAPPFILCIGDVRSNEGLFNLLGSLPLTLTCTVGRREAEAKYYLDNVAEVSRLIDQIAHL